MSTAIAPRASPAFRLCTKLTRSSLSSHRWAVSDSTHLSAQRAAFSQAHSRLAWTAPARTVSKPASASASTSAPSPSPPASTTTPSPPPTTVRATAASRKVEEERSLTDGLSDHPDALVSDNNEQQIDWARSYHGLGNHSFSPEAQQILLAPVDPEDVEVKPDGIIYLPEIKYRRILNRAFGPGGWGLAPRGESIVTAKLVTREYGLVAHGRLVSIARGEQQFFEPDGIPTATEGCKSNALMRCCKDIGIASELWDPRFIRKFLAANTREAWVEHVVNKKKRKITIRKDDAVRYPFQEVKMGGASGKV